ncbi:hypothetical protein [Methanobrevibacter sp.]|uniref:hypothetical protein n=1 Tax=Methanobrevibacter sp. TaxID=66852 RepID=UPI0025D674CA|nr:hypothetical protein [Methanobrevibacter sp.]MBQ2832384.1 hypothetical protein [Methanobrevibacter sp.]
MMEKTKLIFKRDVMEGYVHYINFKRDFSGALEVFKKYILPVGVKIGIDANNDWLILSFSYDAEEEDYLQILEHEWDMVTQFLKEENIQFAYPTWYDDWSLIIPIDDFVEWVLKKYVLEGAVE